MGDENKNDFNKRIKKMSEYTKEQARADKRKDMRRKPNRYFAHKTFEPIPKTAEHFAWVDRDKKWIMECRTYWWLWFGFHRYNEFRRVHK